MVMSLKRTCTGREKLRKFLVSYSYRVFCLEFGELDLAVNIPHRSKLNAVNCACPNIQKFLIWSDKIVWSSTMSVMILLVLL